MLRERRGLPGRADSPEIWTVLPGIRLRRRRSLPFEPARRRLRETTTTLASALLGFLLGQLLF